MNLLQGDITLFKQQVGQLRRYTKNMRVLIAEDYPVLQKSLQKIFSALFFEVDIASDGMEALRLYEKKSAYKQRYDLVFSDIVMPNMDGVTLTKEIKKTVKNQPMIIFSAHQDSSYLLELINLDVRRFILKPISLKNLLEELFITCKSIYDEKNLSNTILLDANTSYHLLERELSIKGKYISLSEQERLILEFFIAKVNQTVSKQEIVNHLYANGKDTDFENVRKMIYKLRKKLSNDLIENIHSVGYRIKISYDDNATI